MIGLRGSPASNAIATSRQRSAGDRATVAPPATSQRRSRGKRRKEAVASKPLSVPTTMPVIRGSSPGVPANFRQRIGLAIIDFRRMSEPSTWIELKSLPRYAEPGRGSGQETLCTERTQETTGNAAKFHIRQVSGSEASPSSRHGGRIHVLLPCQQSLRRGTIAHRSPLISSYWRTHHESSFKSPRLVAEHVRRGRAAAALPAAAPARRRRRCDPFGYCLNTSTIRGQDIIDRRRRSPPRPATTASSRGCASSTSTSREAATSRTSASGSPTWA